MFIFPVGNTRFFWRPISEIQQKPLEIAVTLNCIFFDKSFSGIS